jgi:hypothetical protein
MDTWKDLELHDAIIKRIDVDVAKRSIDIAMEVYPEPSASVRHPAILRFENVVQSTLNFNFAELALNESAGNVGYWRPSNGPGLTYIYLIDGMLAIDHDGITITFRGCAK